MRMRAGTRQGEFAGKYLTHATTLWKLDPTNDALRATIDAFVGELASIQAGNASGHGHADAGHADSHDHEASMSMVGYLGMMPDAFAFAPG